MGWGVGVGEVVEFLIEFDKSIGPNPVFDYDVALIWGGNVGCE